MSKNVSGDEGVLLVVNQGQDEGPKELFYPLSHEFQERKNDR